MRKLYLLLMVLLLSSISSMAQNLQNATWHFGNHAGINFNSNPAIPLTTLPLNLGFNPIEGCASVSDQNGNLLLFTNGQTVWQFWNNSYQVLTNALKGNPTSTQNAIIVQKPNNPQYFYVVTIGGLTSNTPLPNVGEGLHYTEIDLSKGLGQIVSLNTPLQDDLNNIIDDKYGNTSEAITSTIRSDGINYWIVAQIKNTNNSKIFSYLVTENGINSTPLTSVNFPVNNFSYTLKISPNSQNLALSTYMGVFLGTFDNTTGNVVMNNSAIINSVNSYVYGVEFSPDSNNLYYSFNSSIFRTTVNNPNINITATSSLGAMGLQRAINGRIYVANANSQSISSFNTPNDLVNPQYNNLTFSLSNRTCNFGLPQWVWQQPDCVENIILTSTINDVLIGNALNSQASNTITASNVINSGAGAVYHAGSSVVFKPSFNAKAGSTLHVYIAGCTNNFAARKAETASVDITSSKEALIVAPNPSNGIFRVSLNEMTAGTIEIVNLLGASVYKTDFKDLKEMEINIQDKPNGIYIVKVVSKGQTFTSKLIKE